MKRLIPLLALIMTACFTGVESTPRISYRDKGNTRHTISPEATYAASIAHQPVKEWMQGKMFIVEPGKIAYALTPWETAERINPGDTLRYNGMQSTTSPTGTIETFLSLSTGTGDTLYYKVEEALERVMEKDRLEIPFTVEASIVDKASALLTGQDYWILTSQWYADDTTSFQGRRLVPIHVDSVTAGTSLLPIKVHFTDAHDTHAIVYLTPTSSNRLTRSFESQFTLTDPQLKYRDINPEVWDAITRSQVKTGMTRREVRLALGPARQVITAHYMERWNYDNGRYIIFDDDQVTQFKL